MKAIRLSTLAFSISIALSGQVAHAVLERTGPIDTANGFPGWYQDTSGVSIELCLPLTAAELAGGHCLLLPGDPPVVPEVFPSAFFDEHFWWAAGASLTPANGGRALLVLALEAAFSAGVVPGGQIVFTRIRVRLDPVPVGGTYRFIHPYGEESIVAAAGDRIFFTDDVGIGAPGDFTGATQGRVGPFLLPSLVPGGAEIAPIAGPVPGKLYIADPGRLGPVTGSSLPPFPGSDGQLHNHNVFRIEGPAGSNFGGPGIDFIETANFSLMGRIFTGQMPSLVTPERASYTRTASNQKVDVFVTAFPTAASRLPTQPRPAAVPPVTSFYDAPCGISSDAFGNFIAYTQPVGALETQMTAQNNWRWGQLRPAAGAPLPDSICLKDNSAVNISGQPVPAYHQLPVNDEVRVTDAYYDPLVSTLTVSASSSDELAPPTLTLNEFNAALAGGTVTVAGVTAPPARVRVISSARGLGEYNVATAAGSAPPPPAVVVADGDSATTNQGSAVTIPVLAGDTLDGVQINPAVTPIVLAIVANGVKGVALPNNTTGAMTYTPNPGASGADSFTYTVTAAGVTSNIATVTVNITPVAITPETLVANPVEYVVSKNRWKVGGTTSIATAHNLTLKLSGLVGGQPCNANGRVIGSTTSAGNIFNFDILNATGPLDPRTTNCNAIRVESALGAVSPNTTIRLK